MKTLLLLATLTALNTSAASTELVLKRSDVEAMQTRDAGWYDKADLNRVPGVRVQGDQVVIDARNPQLEVTTIVFKGEEIRIDRNGLVQGSGRISLEDLSNIRDIRNILLNPADPVSGIHAGGGTPTPPRPRVDIVRPSGIHAGGGTRPQFMP